MLLSCTIITYLCRCKIRRRGQSLNYLRNNWSNSREPINKMRPTSRSTNGINSCKLSPRCQWWWVLCTSHKSQNHSKNATCADGNYTREHLIRAMCALLKLVVPLHLFDQTYRCMSSGNIPTFEKLKNIAEQTIPGASALEWLQIHTNKIQTADDLALVVCGIKQIWNWAHRKNRKRNIDLKFFASKVLIITS